MFPVLMSHSSWCSGFSLILCNWSEIVCWRVYGLKWHISCMRVSSQKVVHWNIVPLLCQFAFLIKYKQYQQKTFFIWFYKPNTILTSFHRSTPTGSAGLSLCRRRSCMVTWTIPRGRRSAVDARTCACVRTAWACRMRLRRWPCFSSSAAGCPRWPCPPPSTVITWLKLRPEGLRTCRGPR